MAISPVALTKQEVTDNNGTTTDLTVSPTTDNLLVLRAISDSVINGVTDNGTGSWSVVPASYDGGATDHRIFYKIAAGDETTVTLETGNDAPRCLHYQEYEGNATSSVLITSASAASGNSTGTTSATTQPAAYACALRSESGTGGSPNFSGWTNSFTEVADFEATGGTNVALGAADKELFNIGTVETSATGDGSGEGGVMAVFAAADTFLVTARHSDNSGTTAVESETTPSDTPTGDSLLLVFHGAEYNNSEDQGAPPNPSGGGLTYTEIATAISSGREGNSTFPTRGDMARATVGSSPSAFAVTVSVQAAGNDAYQAVVCADVTGYDSVTPIAQSATNTDNFAESSSASGTVTLGSAPTTGNMVVVGFAAGADTGGGFATPTIGGQSMFELHNQNASFCQASLWYRVIDGTESNAVITCSDLGQAVGNYSAVAIEINADTGSTLVTGSLSETQDNQTMSVTAWAEATGTISETQDDQTATITGQAEIVGSVAETQDDQTIAATGFVGYEGTVDVTQDDQTSTASGVIGLTGSLDQTSDDQTMSATGTVGSGGTIGTIIETQDDQTMTASGGASATGTAAPAQEDQTMAASGLADAVGTTSVAQEGDVMVAVGGTGFPVDNPDIRPRRSKLGSRVFPVRWPADKN